MAGKKTVSRERRCVICGRVFEVKSAREKREYCDRKGPCYWKWNEMRRKLRQEERVTEASAAQARTADLLAHAEAKLLIVEQEFGKVDEARQREHEMFGRFVDQVHLMLDKEIMVLNPSSPHWDEREDYSWAMGIISDWRPDGDPTMPADRSELKRKLAQADEEYGRAIAEGDVDAAGAAERRKWRDMDEWWRTHPEEWAQYNISIISQAYREDHDGEEMPYDAVELEWYRREARRRRAELDAGTGGNISGADERRMRQ